MRRGESSSTVTAISYRCPRVVVGSGEGAEINKEEETKNNNCEATFPFPAKVLFLYSAISFTSSLPLSPFSNRGDLLTHSTPGCAITTTPSKSPPSPIITSIYISNLVITKKKKKERKHLHLEYYYAYDEARTRQGSITEGESSWKNRARFQCKFYVLE